MYLCIYLAKKCEDKYVPAICEGYECKMAGAQPYSKDKYHTAWSWTYNRKGNFLIGNCLFMKLLMISENH